MFKNLIARYKLGCLSGFNYSEDSHVNVCIQAILDSEWESIETQLFDIVIKTTCGKRIELWNSNRYYGWMSRGYYKSKQLVFQWDDRRPSADLMYQMKLRIEQEMRKRA